jgi:formylglycine-generating enzyme required for sulfatase activity
MMAKYEVTMAQWQAVMGTAPWRGRPCVVEAPNNPAVFISWKDAQAFTEKLSKLTGSQCRLPTEAEWEYAARAGSSTRFYWGDDPAFEVIDAHAWWRRTALNTGEKYARPVGHKTANGWGLFDMAGNVHEWCQDWYGDYPTEASVNPVGAADGKRRVNRGGSWITYGGACRSARRGQDSPEAAYDDLGFRVVQVFWASSEDVK